MDEISPLLPMIKDCLPFVYSTRDTGVKWRNPDKDPRS